MTTTCVLVVEDDSEMRQMLEEELSSFGFTVVAAANGADALVAMQRERVGAVVTDLMMPGMKGNELLNRLRMLDPNLPVVIMTAFGSVESAVEAMRAGAYHYVTKPFRMEVLIEILRAAVDAHKSQRTGDATAPDAAPLAALLVAESASMKRVTALISRAANSGSPVLIRGESGTGKELVARALHEASPRGQKPFVPVNCSAIPEHLLESLLFGHRRGAFTDAREDRPGLFQIADGGTLFLDEIGDMPLTLQAKLLRAVQDSMIQAVGAPTPIHVDVRILSATHRDLEGMCQSGQFRQDLYYRLNVIPLFLPPLRERQEDLPLLVKRLLSKHSARQGAGSFRFSPEAEDRLRSYPWPGNVRELENAIERAVVFSDAEIIGAEHLPDTLRVQASDPNEFEIRALSEVEREQIVRALQSVKGNKAAAARLLGLDRKTLYRKLELYALKPPPG